MTKFYWNLCYNEVFYKGTFLYFVFFSGLSNPEGFAIDWLSGNMYFSSYHLTAKTASISVATLSGSFRTELIIRNITEPKSIALHPEKGYVFCFNPITTAADDKF